MIKEHYIILDEDDEIIYNFYYNISSRGSIIQNSYMLKNKKFMKINKDMTKLKIQLFLKIFNENDDTIINLNITNHHQKNF